MLTYFWAVQHGFHNCSVREWNYIQWVCENYAKTPDFKMEYFGVSAELEAEMFKVALEELNLKTEAEPSSSLITKEFKILNTKAETSCSLIRAATTLGNQGLESNHESILLSLYKLQFNNVKLRCLF
ncbi:Hypothetical predicted protein [Olea europaea subsp. europaea]|uniref:Uncharacterized protein n=1 Tax=Olea europaea subsp. europaea TaxID=158383 RepID=A0A8S0VJD3_OLEEU|nr:Hypothetical predicted protein [Olea europaea subsp. europaea]